MPIAITATHPDPLRIDSVINLTAVPTVVHPIGANPTEVYEWTDHLGNVIGTALAINYTPTLDGWLAVQIKITYEDIAEGYYLEVTEDESFYVQPYEIKDNIFSLPYSIDTQVDPYSNMDIHRVLSNFPAWSSAYQNFQSNASKFLSPIIEPLSHGLDEMDTVVENNTNFDGLVHFGYRDQQHEIVTFKIPDLIHTEHGNCTYIGSQFGRSLESAPIKAVNTKEPGVMTQQSFTTYSSNDFKVFAYPSILYVQCDNASFAGSVLVELTGINEVGDTVRESFLLLSSSVFETINKYKIVYDINISNNQEVTLSSYIDLSTYHSSDNGLNLQKRICNIDGNYFEPVYSNEDNNLFVLNGSVLSHNDIYKFELQKTPDAYFVTNLLDVIYLSNNTVYASKLMLDYYNTSQKNSSANINSFINVSDINTSIGEDIVVTIKCDNLKSEFNPSSIRLSIDNNDERYYLGSDLILNQDKNSWINISQANNFISFNVPVTNNKPYVFELEINNRRDSFIAMSHMNILNEYHLMDDVQEIFIYNKELWAKTTGDDYYILDPVRLAFTSGVNRVYLFNDFEQAELVYKDE